MSIVLLAGLISIEFILPAAAEVDDDEAERPGWSAAADDASFLVDAEVGDLLARVNDTATGVSEQTWDVVGALYDESDVLCALRQGSDEGGEYINAETDLCESEDGLTTADVVALVSSEFQRLPLTAPVIAYQPEGEWALVNVDFVVYTDPSAQVLETTILGVPVTVRATPVSYSWDFGDGCPPLVTSSPGQPYPHQTIAHVYTSASEGVEVTLTTSWQGELQINGSGTWLPIAGFATTTSSTPSVEIVAMDVHLVP